MNELIKKVRQESEQSKESQEANGDGGGDDFRMLIRLELNYQGMICISQISTPTQHNLFV